MQSIPYVMLSSIPMFVCGFWTLTFLGQYKSAHISKKVIFWFMLTATSLYFAHFVVFNHLYSLIPLTDTIYTFATLSVYPIFFLYIIALTGKLNLSDFWVLIPGLLIASVIGICYLLIPDSLMRNFIKVCHYDIDFPISHSAELCSLKAHHLMKPIIVMEVIPVLYFGFKRIHQFKRRVEQSFSNTEHKDLSGVKTLLIVFVITSCLSVIADLMGRAFFVGTCFLVSLPTLSFGIVLFIIGHITDHQRFTINDLKEEEQGVSNTLNTLTSVQDADNPTEDTTNNEREALRKAINQLMIDKQLFLKPDLKVSDVASELNTNRTYIYEALKSNNDSQATTSFTDYVNQYRIIYCLNLLRQSKNANIETLAYESGFLSKATFYKNFKKFTGKTPSCYLKSQQNEES